MAFVGLNGLVDTSAERYLSTGLRLRSTFTDDRGRWDDDGREDTRVACGVGMLVYDCRNAEDTFRPRDGANAMLPLLVCDHADGLESNGLF